VQIRAAAPPPSTFIGNDDLDAAFAFLPICGLTAQPRKLGCRRGDGGWKLCLVFGIRPWLSIDTAPELLCEQYTVLDLPLDLIEDRMPVLCARRAVKCSRHTGNMEGSQRTPHVSVRPTCHLPTWRSATRHERGGGARHAQEQTGIPSCLPTPPYPARQRRSEQSPSCPPHVYAQAAPHQPRQAVSRLPSAILAMQAALAHASHGKTA
jgi:hypothetical protein